MPMLSFALCASSGGCILDHTGAVQKTASDHPLLLMPVKPFTIHTSLLQKTINYKGERAKTPAQQFQGQAADETDPFKALSMAFSLVLVLVTLPVHPLSHKTTQRYMQPGCLHPLHWTTCSTRLHASRSNSGCNWPACSAHICQSCMGVSTVQQHTGTACGCCCHPATP